MQTGSVKFFNENKGYGFIRDDESGEEMFVHATGLVDEIEKDDKVSFEVKEGNKCEKRRSIKPLLDYLPQSNRKKGLSEWVAPFLCSAHRKQPRKHS